MTDDADPTGRGQHCEHWDHHQRTSKSPTAEGITVEQWHCAECEMEWSVRRRSTTGEELAVEVDELRAALAGALRSQGIWFYLLGVGAGMAVGAVLIFADAAPAQEIIVSGLGIFAIAIVFSILFPDPEEA